MVSVIIPIYNTPKELNQCIASLSRQIYKDIEIIIVDDGSSPEIDISSIECCYPDLNIKFFKINHAGAPRARNYGFSKSKGDYVLFCDADLILSSQCIDIMLARLKKKPDKSYVYSDFKYGWKKFKAWPFDAKKLKRINYINTCSLIRRSHFPDTGWDQSLDKFQDWDLWLTFLDQGKTGIYVPELLFKAQTKRGIYSRWLPKFFYKLPWLKINSKNKYEKWKKIVQQKHKISF